MNKLNFSKSSPESLERLSDVQDKIDDFCKEHPRKKLTDEQREELGELLRERAAALSDALGVKISSIVD